ncbi:MAG: hypothetical protein HYX92_21505 [Chloroflexi bacterium]|nr:hypothetical protein [Chloroflexota bacterium]
MQTGKLFAVATTVLGLLAASCGPVSSPTPTTKPAAPPAKVETPVAKPAVVPAAPTPTPKAVSEQPRYGGILNISHEADPRSYDPIQEITITAMAPVAPNYSGIVQHDPLQPTKVIGDLAEKWEMSSDGSAYTFQLYKGVKWHDGAPFTSEDARFTLELVRKPPRGIVSTKQEWLNAVERIEAPDRDTLKITLQYPSASFMDNLGDGRMLIVPKHVFEDKGNMRRDIVGTGPFKLKAHTSGATFSVAKNPDYFIKGRPYLDGITWYIIPDSSTRFAALRTQRIHATALASQGLTPSQAAVVEKELADRITLYTYQGLTNFAFWMPHNRAPWSDVRVRRAVHLAIDREKVIRVSSEGVGDPAGFVPTGAWSLPEAELKNTPGYRQPKDADTAEAKRLMAEAGYAQGIKTTTVVRNIQERERGAVAVREQLAPIGIDVTVRPLDQATLLDLLYKRTYDTAISSSSTASYDDPDQTLGEGFLSGVLRNFSDFSDEQTDKWYREQARALDPGKRKTIVLDMQRRMFELVPAVMLYWRLYQLGVFKEVKDYKAGVGVYNNLKFQNVWLTR